MGQYGDQQQGHCQGTSNAIPHDGNNSFVSFHNSSPYDTVILGMDNFGHLFSSHDWKMPQDSHVQGGQGNYNESGDSNSFFSLFILLISIVV